LQDIARGSELSHFEVTLADGAELPLAPGWGIRRRLVFDLAPQSALQPPAEASGQFVDAYFAAHAIRKLHLGCGDHLLHGWLNTDLQPRVPGVQQLDASKPLPFADDSVDYVFSEHVIEHMPYPQGCSLLAECLRILKPGGVMRIATPDLAFLIGLYQTDKSAIQQAFLDWSKERFLHWAPTADATFVINNAVRDWGHQFIYDDKVLRRALAEAGFGRIARKALMESDVADLCGLESETRSPPGLLAAETLVLEAAKG
jgi:predicted SAM-dependent methyltransferase